MRPLPLAGAILLVLAALLLRRRLGTVGTAAGLALAAALAVYASGAVALPDLEESLGRVGPALGSWTYLLIGLLAYLETAALVGLVAPGEMALVLGGVVAGQGEVDLWVLIPLAWAAAVAGDTTSYLLGRRLGRGFLLAYGARFGIGERELARTERFFDGHGGKTIVAGRFIGFVRALAPFVAGASRMPVRRFVLFDLVGAGAWSASFLVLGYLSWQSLDRALALAKQGNVALGAALAAALAALAAYRLVRAPELRARLRAEARRRLARLRGRGAESGG